MKIEEMLVELQKDIDEAQTAYDQFNEAYEFRRKTDLLGSLRMQVAGAKALRRWYQSRNLNVEPANVVYNEAMDKLIHHTNVKATLKMRRKDACDRLWIRKKIYSFVKGTED